MNGDSKGPLCGVGGYSSMCFGERDSAVIATGGTVTPGGSLTHLTCVAQSTGLEGKGG